MLWVRVKGLVHLVDGFLRVGEILEVVGEILSLWVKFDSSGCDFFHFLYFLSNFGNVFTK